MEKTLALFFASDFLQAAVKPFKGKFTMLSSTDDNRYYFYFKINPYTRQTDFGADYKKNFLDRGNLFLGDLIKNIEENNSFSSGGFQADYLTLFDCIIRPLRVLYEQKLKTFDGSFSLSDQEKINASAVFSDDIPDKVKQRIIDYFNKSSIEIKTVKTLDVLAVKYFVAKKGLYCVDRKFVVLEALGNNLNMSYLRAETKEVVRENFRRFKGYGIDPMVKVIAEKIVKSVNLAEHIIDSDDKDEINAEIIRHYSKAEAVIRHFEANPQKTTIKISTVFACNPLNKIAVNLSLDELNKTAYNISRQYSAFFTNSFLSEYDIKINSLENIILVGNPLSNPAVEKEFNTLAGNKTVYFNNFEAGEFLTEIFSENDVSYDEEATAFLTDCRQEEVKPEVLTQLNISSLQKGQRVRIDTFDNTPGKGAAFQEFEFMGGVFFSVISSGRSLKKGDKAQSVFKVWKTGVQLDFIVERNGRSLGRFRTREVTKITVD